MNSSDALLGDGLPEQAIHHSERAKRTGVLGDHLRWWCPGCRSEHVVPIKPFDPTGWDFDGDLGAPTLHPSVLVLAHQTLNTAGTAFLAAGGSGADLTDEHRTSTPRCHTFIRAGRIEFLSDCTHELAGQTVPMCIGCLA